MGGRNKIATLGPFLLLASTATAVSIPSAFASDLVITSSRTTPADTATGDGTGPGNITIETSGAVDTTGPAAVTLNSNNSISNAGGIINSTESNASGISILTTSNGVANNISGTVTNTGNIVAAGPAEKSTLLNADVFNSGIKLSGLGTFTGDIINDNIHTSTSVVGTITVAGNASSGINIASTLNGNLRNIGIITVTGEHSYGILTTGHITGNFTTSGITTVSNKEAVGNYIGGGIDGAYKFNGVLNAGTGAQLTSTNGVTVTRLDPLPAKAGVWVASNIGQGMLFTGNRLTATEQVLDPAAAAAATPSDSSINVVGGGPGLLIAQGGPNNTLANITISPGADTGGYAVKTQGNILVAGSIEGLSTTAVRVQGIQSGSSIFTTTLTGGLWNDKGNIQTLAIDATGIGIHVGNYGVVPSIQNDGELLVNTQDTTTNTGTGALGTKGGDAYGILVESQGTVNAIGNTGNLVVETQGPTASAYAIVDRSGKINSLTNSGALSAFIQTGATGKAIAADLSANTTGVTVINTGAINGDVLLGAGNSSVSITGANSKVNGAITYQAGALKTGNNTFTLNGGTVSGLVDLGNGTHTVALSNGAKATGGIGQGTGTLSLGVDASQLTILSAKPVNASTATFTSASTLNFGIDNSATTLPNGLLRSTGAVSVSANSKITATFTGLIEGEKTITVIRAGALSLGAPLSTIATAPVSYINSSTFSISATDPNALLLTVKRKTATDLGLGANTTAIYNAFNTALNADVPLVTTLSALQTQDEFNNAIRQLMPDSSGALRQAALNNQDMAAGAVRRRLVGVAKNGMPDHAAGDVASFWAQALGDYGDQRAQGEQSGFEVWGLGIALGADMPVFNDTTNIGVSFAETWHSANLKVSAKSPVEFYNSQVNFYGRYSGRSIYVQGSFGGGYNSYNQERQVKFGDISRLAIGKWKGYEYGGVAEVGYMTRFSAYQFNPYVRGAYQKNHENAYTETGGGTGIDLTVAGRNADSARASVGFTVDRDFPIYYDSYVEAELRGNFTREFKNDPYAVTAQFAVGSAFTNMSNARNPNRANIGIGISHKDSYSSVSVDYDAEMSKGYLAHKAGITARFRF